ncbi:MAG: hypothetical protein EXR94_06775 [Gemmatimonadetes bacterium]|nr:hypothetical protein [Gemmatimonadota bacterium]
MADTKRRDRFEGYEVFDSHGKSVGRVILPRTTRPPGPSNGTVFLRRQPVPRPKAKPQAA